MNLVYLNRGVPKQPVPPPPQTQVQSQPIRPVSIANKSLFQRVVKPEGGCGCGGGH
jgi:hypothetical protein